MRLIAAVVLGVALTGESANRPPTVVELECAQLAGRAYELERRLNAYEQDIQKLQRIAAELQQQEDRRSRTWVSK